jgi:hypothetical protein
MATGNFTEKGAEYAVRAHRETIKAVGDVTLPAIRGVTVDRSLSQIATESFTIAGKTYTGGDIANVLSAIADI